MKMDKKFMKQMLIILLVVFIIVPIVLMLFGMNDSVQEGFYTYDQNSKTDSELKISALDVSGLDISSGTGGNIETEHRIVGETGDYMYCVHGNIECAPGYTISDEDISINGVNIKKYQCISGGIHDPTQAKCTGSIFETDSTKQFYLLDASNCWKPDATTYMFGSVESLHGGTQSISGDLSQFTTIYNNKLPFETTDKDGNSNYGVSAEQLNFNAPKDTFTFKGLYSLSAENDANYSTCFFYNTYGECEVIGKCPSILPGGKTEEEKECKKTDGAITCNADYGAKVGDSLCCGQTGVVQNDSRICPHEYPTCSGYKCGEKWGTCS